MLDERRERLLHAVAVAARQYRDTMRRYMAEQARLLEAGVPLTELVERNWAAFEETARAEETLYDALDALDGDDSAASVLQ